MYYLFWWILAVDWILLSNCFNYFWLFFEKLWIDNRFSQKRGIDSFKTLLFPKLIRITQTHESTSAMRDIHEITETELHTLVNILMLIVRIVVLNWIHCRNRNFYIRNFHREAIKVTEVLPIVMYTHTGGRDLKLDRVSYLRYSIIQRIGNGFGLVSLHFQFPAEFATVSWKLLYPRNSEMNAHYAKISGPSDHTYFLSNVF